MSIELKQQIQSHIKDKSSELYAQAQEYQVRLLLKDNTVATAMHFNPLVAEDKALDTAVQYGLKQGWIKEASPYFSFSKALELLKQGDKIARKGWNGKGMWLMLIPKSHWETTRGLEMLDGLPWVGMKTVDDKFVPWLPSQTDLFTDDWMIAQ
jgi:hypothetical protein